MKDLDWLKKNLESEVKKNMTSKTALKFLKPGFIDKRYYAIYLAETFHYTFHNSRNQALVASRKEVMNINYMKFCLKHAAEETGHEMMALHDLKQLLNIDISVKDLPTPLDSTKALTAYLYYIAEYENPLARLGYSYWAERVYQYIKPMLTLLKFVGIEKKAMTFFNEHAEIDADHAKDIDHAINTFAKTDADWEAINGAMLTSLRLTMAMVDEIMAEFVKVKDKNQSTRYRFLE